MSFIGLNQVFGRNIDREKYGRNYDRIFRKKQGG